MQKLLSFYGLKRDSKWPKKIPNFNWISHFSYSFFKSANIPIEAFPWSSIRCCLKYIHAKFIRPWARQSSVCGTWCCQSWAGRRPHYTRIGLAPEPWLRPFFASTPTPHTFSIHPCSNLREVIKKEVFLRSGWPSGCCDFFRISWHILTYFSIL